MDIKTIKRKNDFYEEDSIDSKKYNDENISISKNFKKEKKFKKIINFKDIKNPSNNSIDDEINSNKNDKSI